MANRTGDDHHLVRSLCWDDGRCGCDRFDDRGSGVLHRIRGRQCCVPSNGRSLEAVRQGLPSDDNHSAIGDDPRRAGGRVDSVLGARRCREQSNVYPNSQQGGTR